MIDELLETKGTIFQTMVPNEDITLRYRLLTLKEYDIFNRLKENDIFNQHRLATKVFERCFLGNPDFLSQNIPAGIIISIGNLILWLSGDCDRFTLMEDIERHKKLNRNDTVFDYMRAAIFTVFPTLDFNEFENLDREELLKRFTIAENILEKQRDNYSRLKLEKKDSKKVNSNGSKIDFEKENAILRSKQNPYDIEEAQSNVRKTEGRLNKQQLQKLSRMRR